MIPYDIRPATTNDFNFIISTWVQSFREHSGVEYKTYNKHQNQLVRDILSRAITIIACAKEDPNLIHGYLVFEKTGEDTALHWSYVKSFYRNMGIAKEMLAQIKKNEIYFTHKPTKEGWLLKKIEEMGMLFCPYLSYGEQKYEEVSSRYQRARNVLST
jgi:ribosomal protein S18 acetylase RimI-like enzyme